jgi:hypothetical protein
MPANLEMRLDLLDWASTREPPRCDPALPECYYRQVYAWFLVSMTPGYCSATRLSGIVCVHAKGLALPEDFKVPSSLTSALFVSSGMRTRLRAKTSIERKVSTSFRL